MDVFSEWEKMDVVKKKDKGDFNAEKSGEAFRKKTMKIK
jgi:hypothetical protein